MNRELHTENRTIDQWANAIAARTDERRFCDYWQFPTEAEKAGMISAARLKYQKLAFWVAVGVSVVTLIILIAVTIETRDLAQSVLPGSSKRDRPAPRWRSTGGARGGSGPTTPRR